MLRSPLERTVMLVSVNGKNDKGTPGRAVPAPEGSAPHRGDGVTFSEIFVYEACALTVRTNRCMYRLRRALRTIRRTSCCSYGSAIKSKAPH